MKNLIQAVTTEQKTRLENFKLDVNKLTTLKDFDIWQYRDLLPKGKRIESFTDVSILRSYLVTRKEKEIYKEITKQVDKINTIGSAGKLISVKIQIEWKKSRMWGNNPSAEAWCIYMDKNGISNSHYVTSGSIGGCGYDKKSTAVAKCLNQFNEVLKPLYITKNTALMVDPEPENRDLLGYGSGYGILPYIEGGVGVSCYNKIFEAIGYKFESVASGKNFDAYQITKK